MSLRENASVSLSDTFNRLSPIDLQVSWNAPADHDFFTCTFALAKNGQVRSDADVIWYHNYVSYDGSIEHRGRDYTGTGEVLSYAEAVSVDLSRIPPDIQRLVIALTLHQGDHGTANPTLVSAASIRVINRSDGQEITRHALADSLTSDAAMICGEVSRDDSGWVFNACGHEVPGGIAALASLYGVSDAA